MVHCLSKLELCEILDYFDKKEQPKIEGLLARAENAQLWIDELSALTYLFSQIIEKRLSNDINCDEIIPLYYNLENLVWLQLQNFDIIFIENLLHNLTNDELDLEEELIDCQNRLREYSYAQNLRY
jgi:hypothetical protein